jgi:hypothetical protein
MSDPCCSPQMSACPAPCISSKKNAPSPSSVPDNPAIHRLVAVSPNAYPPYIKPISGGYRLPSRKAKRNGRVPEARTAPKAGLPVLRTETTGPRKACERLRRTDAAMKDGKNLRWRAGRSLQGWRLARSRTDAALGRWLAGPSTSRPAWRDVLRKLLPRPCPDLTGRRWEKSRRRLSLGSSRYPTACFT